MIKRILTAVLFIFSLLIQSFECESQGLRFTGLEQSIDKRTSYDVFGSKPRSFYKQLGISFELQTYPEAERGYILRIKTGSSNKVPVINLFYDGAKDSLRFMVNAEGQKTLIRLRFPKLIKGKASEWLKIRLVLDMEKDSVKLTAGKDSAAVHLLLPDVIKGQILFGKSDYNIDVPSFAIKNLVIGDGHKYSFPLDEESGEKVKDSDGRIKGIVKNPVWLFGNYSKWRKLGKYNSGAFFCAGYDSKKHEIYFFDNDSIHFYNIPYETVRSRAFRNRCPVSITIGTNFMDNETGRIYSYEVYYDKPDKGPVTLSVLDTNTMEWTALSDEKKTMQMHHHDEWLDSEHGRFLIYGGFGNSRYNGDFYSLDMKSYSWTKCRDICGDKPWPRYFSAMGYEDKEKLLYIYGGMGNKSGNQVVGREYIYNLYSVDPVSLKAKKLWEIPWKGPNSVAARNMILTGDGYFYVLCYPESVTESELHLYKFKIKDGSHEILGNPIPIFSDKITTNANLFYDKELRKLITIVEESPDDIKSSVTLYSIEYPPRAADINHNGNEAIGKRKKTGIAFVSSILAIIFLASFIIYKKKKKTSPSPDAGKPAMPAKGTARLKPFEIKGNSIFLFGGFSVKARDGEDISGLFTEKIKELFCLVLQYSDDGGISSKRLSGLIWPDKEENKAKNIRGVTINSLRKILGRLDGIELIFEEGKFRIVIGKDLFCDYTEYERLITSKDYDSDDLIRILARGNILCEEEDPIFDKLKDDVESTAEPAMETEMIERYRSSDYQNAILCSDIIFYMDPLNETALSYSVRALMALGRDEDARLRYNSFITLYKHDYEEDYPKTFESF